MAGLDTLVRNDQSRAGRSAVPASRPVVPRTQRRRRTALVLEKQAEKRRFARGDFALATATAWVPAYAGMR
jgi:hypothetical protein